MVRRRTHHPIRVTKPIPKEKKQAPTKKKVAVVIGKAYSLEELQKLIAALTSGDGYQEVSAIAEFAENQSAISDAASKTSEVSGTDIVELVIQAMIKNEKEMFKRFEAERKVQALKFAAQSSAVPEKLQKKASTILSRVEVQAPTKELAKKKEEVPTVHKIPYTPKQVQALISSLDSTVKEIKISAAIKFIKDYAKITPTVAKMPLLTVTAVTKKALQVIEKAPEIVIKKMKQKKMVPELLFLSSLGQASLSLRKKAKAAAETFKSEFPKLFVSEEKPVVSEKPVATEKKVETKTKEVKVVEPGPRSKEYTPFELSALLDGLGSTERVRVVKTATEFLKNYDVIVKSVSKAPMLTVTEVTKKAVTAVESNLNAVLKELQRTKAVPALNLLANSSEFSEQTRKKAEYVLKQLMPPFGEDK